VAPLAAQVNDGILEIITPAGIVLGVLEGPEEATDGVLMLGGAIGGFGGPAGRVYHELAPRLADRGIASLRLHGRVPSEVESCVQDALLALHWWSTSLGVGRVVVVGHSLGGATAITVAALNSAVAGCVGLASQTAGTELVDRLEGRPLLLVHGREDRVLPAMCSENIHSRAREPRELVLLDGCGHLMSEAADEVIERVKAFAVAALGHDPR
jgi:pimeloyl-ACP methyl ester carboxylesterase